jgi:hypothetical protein
MIKHTYRVSNVDHNVVSALVQLYDSGMEISMRTEPDYRVIAATGGYQTYTEYHNTVIEVTFRDVEQMETFDRFLRKGMFHAALKGETFLNLIEVSITDD